MSILDDYKKLIGSKTAQQVVKPTTGGLVGTPPSTLAAHIAEQQELEKQQRVAQVLQEMHRTATSNAAKMQEVATTTATLLKGFSPTALAKVIARDDELKDLIAKALFLAPAYQTDTENPA